MNYNPVFDSASPIISHNCLIKFQFVYRNLKTAERKAADYCLKHPDLVATRTIVEVAQEVGCSAATLGRLARRLGYSGYPELREKILRKDSEDTSHYIDISPTDSIANVTNTVFNLCALYLQDSLQAVDKEQLHLAAQALLKAKKFLFVATGDAHFAAASAAQKFMRIGYYAIAPTDFDTQLLTLSQMSSDDVLFCLSYSGRSKNICDIARIAKEHEIKVISITNYPVSPLSKNSDIILLTASFAYDIMDEIIAKRIPALCLLDALYLYLMVRQRAVDPEKLNRANKFLLLNKI